MKNSERLGPTNERTTQLGTKVQDVLPIVNLIAKVPLGRVWGGLKQGIRNLKCFKC